MAAIVKINVEGWIVITSLLKSGLAQGQVVVFARRQQAWFNIFMSEIKRIYFELKLIKEIWVCLC